MMKSYFLQVWSVVYKLLILLLMFTICRMIFFMGNYHQFSQIDFTELLKIFVVGIRFDAAALIEINLLFFIIYALPLRFVQQKRFLKYLTILFYVVNALVVLLNLIDTEYFKYTSQRSTADLFQYATMSSDVAVLIPQFLKDFWYIPVCWILIFIMGIFLMERKIGKRVELTLKGWKNYTSASVVFIGLMGGLFVIARGLELKPLRIISATSYTQSQNIPLLLNTPFCIIHTLGQKGEAIPKYFNDVELEKQYNPEQQFKSGTVRRDNIVIIILESFSQDFVGSLTGGKTYTPNLDSIIQKGLAFENAFANGKKSLEALPSVFAGIPALTDNAYVSSRYSSNRLEAMPFVLSKLGYHTSFFCGGRKGSGGYDYFTNLAGISHYFGMGDYQGPEAFDGNWGIFDDAFYGYCAKKINEFPQPFISGILSLSSHHPYLIPERLQKLFPADETEVHRSMMYGDYSLGQFFKEVEHMPWFKHTLFIITADHTARGEGIAEDNTIKKYRVPIVFYHPGDSSISGKSEKIVQQTDIMPSVYEYLGINSPFVAFGQSVFSSDSTWTVHYIGGIYRFISGNYVLSFNGEKSISLESIKKGIKPNVNLIDQYPDEALKMEKQLKAIIQQYFTRLTQNKMYSNKGK